MNIISWLERRFWHITFTQEEDIDVKDIRDLLNEKEREDRHQRESYSPQS